MFLNITLLLVLPLLPWTMYIFNFKWQYPLRGKPQGVLIGQKDSDRIVVISSHVRIKPFSVIESLVFSRKYFLLKVVH